MPENQEPRTKNQPSGDAYTYRNLILWQKAQQLTLEIIRLIAEAPSDKVVKIIADRIVRCSSSIGANIAEGHGRFTPRAHGNYLSIAKASACETDSFLDLLHRAGYVSAAREAALHSDCEEIIRMLTRKIVDLERLDSSRQKSPRIGDESGIYIEGDAPDNSVLGSGF